MNYLVFDLEFNQGFNFKDENITTINPECPFEIIDIGAIKLDENLNTIAAFDELVKPAVYRRLHPFVQKITGITRKSLKTAKPFREVYEDFIEFISDVDVLCVWGTADIKELIRNMEYYKLDSSKVPMKYINVQHYASRHLESPGGNSVGLGNAVKLMNIPFESEFHKAFNDAYYTAEVLKKINIGEIEPLIYIYNNEMKPKDTQGTKTVLDTPKLIAQFEKMFNRKITHEEQAMIKLAYKMGHSNQFRKQMQ